MSDDPLWQKLARLTPARIGLGRAGSGLPTREVLKFGLAHAQARDAVHVPMDADAVAAAIEALGYTTLHVASRAEDRATYLRRPDRGRALSDESAKRLAAAVSGKRRESTQSSHPHPHPEAAARSDAREGGLNPLRSLEASLEAADAVPRDEGEGTGAERKPTSTQNRAASGLGTGSVDLALVVADGLSARAVHEGADKLLAALKTLIDRNNWNVAPVVIAEQARVALGDVIGAALKAQIVAVLIGERPGLSSPESLGIYLTYDPKSGRSDAERNCISNVRSAGLGYEAAAARLAWLIEQALARKLTGVGLKDASDLIATKQEADNRACSFNSSVDVARGQGE